MRVPRPVATNPRATEWTASARSQAALEFHRSMPGYAATPLVELPTLAAELGAAGVWLKDESNRFGLPAFKVLGASWATNHAIGARQQRSPAPTFAALTDRAREVELTLVTATDGNHGRALAHVARLLGLRARIYVAGGVPERTIQAIRDEGAEVVATDRVYDDAVRQAATSTEGTDDLLIQDTAWTGYETIPQAIVAGYSSLFAEVDEQLPGAPGLVAVPTGVGSLLQAALEHYRSPGRADRPAVLAVEPVSAACVTASLAAGHPVSVDTSAPTAMAGLNCGTISEIAWPAIRQGLDGGVGVTARETATALRDLHALGVSVGPCGAAALAGVRVGPLPVRGANVVLISTEGIDANRQ